MFYDSLTLADTSGAVEAVVHGGLPRPGGRRLPDCVAARGPPQEVSSAEDCWKSKISHFPGKSQLLELKKLTFLFTRYHLFGKE